MTTLVKSVLLPSCLFFSISLSQSAGTRVCTTWIDYLNPLSTNCFDNPDGKPSNMSQILQRWGCITEEYELLTPDGYYILVVRAILNSVTKVTPIVMGHGINMNANAYVTMFNKTIAYTLLQMGYEIYFINFRGTKYSYKHQNLTQNDFDYWKFSFHQMGKYDIRTTLDLVENKTSGAQAIYIGFSMGTTAINVYSILYPEEAARRLLGVIEMAPIANLTDIRSIVRTLSPSWPVIKELATTLRQGNLPSNQQQADFCASGVIPIFSCYTSTILIFGPNYDMLDPLYRPVTNQQNKDTIGFMVIDHYYQILESSQFLYYDYGTVQNMVEYGSVTPPAYDVSKVLVKTALILGEGDYLSEVENGKSLYGNLPSSSRCGFKILPDPNWTHDGFISSKDLPVLVDEVVGLVSIMESGTCA